MLYASDPEWARYLSQTVAPDHFGFEQAQEFVKRSLPVSGSPTTNFAMEVSGEMIGSFHLLLQEDDGMAELACLISRAHWGGGLAAQAGGLMLDYAFGKLQLFRVFARADARNHRSIRAMHKLGMQQEAFLRSHRVDRSGTRSDEVMFGILRTDWDRCRSST